MCPACLSALALTVVGTGSAGGLTAFVVRNIRRKKRRASMQIQPATDTDERAPAPTPDPDLEPGAHDR